MWRVRKGEGSMISKKNSLILDTLARLLRRNALQPLKKVLDKTHASDLAPILARFPEDEALILFGLIPETELAAKVLSKVEASLRDIILRGTPVEILRPILEDLSPDDLADLIGDQDSELASLLLEGLAWESQQEVEELLQYPSDSAGGIMTPDVFALRDDNTVEQAIASIREHEDVEMIFYLYVTDKEGHLQGVVSLRQLLQVGPEQTLRDIMKVRMVKAHTSDDQEDVANLVEQYRILAIPVVDDQNVLCGLITMDDIIDVIQDETTEDMLKMAGTDEGEMLTQSPFRIARLRLPWLFAAFLGGLAATGIIHQFEGLLTKVLALSAFLPIVMGMAGNVGTQSATVAVRGLATGHLDLTRAKSFVLKELWVGLILGVIYGTALGIVGWLAFESVDLGTIVGLTVFSNMSVAAVIAIILPIIFHKIGSDPAIATGPFVTTAIDILGVGNYFLIASWILNIPTTG